MPSQEKPTHKPELLSAPFSVLSLLHPHFTELHRPHNSPQLPKSILEVFIVPHDPPKDLGKMAAVAHGTAQAPAEQPVEAAAPVAPTQIITPVQAAPLKPYVQITHVNYYPNPAIVPFGQPSHLYPGNFARYLTTIHEQFYSV